MELVSILNFESSTQEMDSPRTLEACLRAGVDPQELVFKSKKALKTKGLTDSLLEIKFQALEKRRREKIDLVRRERDAILLFPKLGTAPSAQSPDKQAVKESVIFDKRSSAVIELERERLEALRRRQEKELAKMVERERALAELQDKLKNAEEQELLRHRQHEKKVAEQKSQAQKKQIARQQELARLEHEEAARRRDIARRDAEFEAKVKSAAIEAEAKLKQESKQRDIERERKVQEFQRKTYDLLESQLAASERNRQVMLEREERVHTQLEEKKARKGAEETALRVRAEERIQKAMLTFVEEERRKKEAFMKRRDSALERAAAIAKEEVQVQARKAEARDKHDKHRYHRLLEAYRHRAEYRADLSQRISAKSAGFEETDARRRERARTTKFLADLRMEEKQENVERTGRLNEFKRLQILRRIEDDDARYEQIQEQKRLMMESHRQEVQQGLIRKHEIVNAMETMRTTNDFTLLDKLFESKKKQLEEDRRTGEEEDAALIT